MVAWICVNAPEVQHFYREGQYFPIAIPQSLDHDSAKQFMKMQA